ncbi:MAG: class I SAM-dependent methyltransferase, partial [Bacteroidota bacterium]
VEDPLAVGWRDEEVQRLRFEAVTSIANLDQAEVLDLGCGAGALKLFIDAHFQEVRYTGVEIIPELFEAAGKQIGHLPNTRLLLTDFAHWTLPEVDVVFACGALSYRSSDPTYLARMLENMYRASRVGVAITLMRNSVHRKDYLQAYQPEEVLPVAKRIADHVEVAEDYLMDDFALFLHHAKG